MTSFMTLMQCARGGGEPQPVMGGRACVTTEPVCHVVEPLYVEPYNLGTEPAASKSGAEETFHFSLFKGPTRSDGNGSGP